MGATASSCTCRRSDGEMTAILLLRLFNRVWELAVFVGGGVAGAIERSSSIDYARKINILASSPLISKAIHMDGFPKQKLPAGSALILHYFAIHH
jgi:hypothetical protein